MPGSALELHTQFAWVVVVGNALSGLWCLGAHWIPVLRVRALWWAVVFIQVSVFVQVALGVWVLAVDDINAPGFHTFYGFLTVITVAIMYSYRAQMRAQQYLLYGFGGLFLMGLGIRAMVLG